MLRSLRTASRTMFRSLFRIKAAAVAAALVAVVVAAVGVNAVPSASDPTAREVELSLDFEASGRIVDVPVRPGDQVRTGQLLGRIDDAEARAALAQAEANLESARADVEKLKEGMSAEEIAEATAAVAQAQATVDAAAEAYENALAATRTDAASLQAAVDLAAAALANTRAKVAESTRARQLAVDQATRALADAERQQALEQHKLDEARAKLAADRAAYEQRGCAAKPDDNQCRTLAEAVEQGVQAVKAADAAVATAAAQTAKAADDLALARQNAASGAVDDQRAVLDAEATLATARANQAKGSVDAESALDQAAATRRAAELAKRATEAGNAAKHQGPTVNDLAMAMAKVKGAEAGVASARVALQKTRLLAPADGVIVSVTKHVGELSQGGGGGSAGGESGGDSGSFVTMVGFDRR